MLTEALNCDLKTTSDAGTIGAAQGCVKNMSRFFRGLFLLNKLKVLACAAIGPTVLLTELANRG